MEKYKKNLHCQNDPRKFYAQQSLPQTRTVDQLSGLSYVLLVGLFPVILECSVDTYFDTLVLDCLHIKNMRSYLYISH